MHTVGDWHQRPSLEAPEGAGVNPTVGPRSRPGVLRHCWAELSIGGGYSTEIRVSPLAGIVAHALGRWRRRSRSSSSYSPWRSLFRARLPQREPTNERTMERQKASAMTEPGRREARPASRRPRENCVSVRMVVAPRLRGGKKPAKS